MERFGATVLEVEVVASATRLQVLGFHHPIAYA